MNSVQNQRIIYNPSRISSNISSVRLLYLLNYEYMPDIVWQTQKIKKIRKNETEYPWQVNEDRKDNKMYDNDDKRHNDMGEKHSCGWRTSQNNKKECANPFV